MSRRLVAGLVTVGLLLAVAGCGSDDSDDEGQASKDSGGAKEFKLGVSMIDLSNPFFVSMREAGLKAAEDYGVEASFQSADGSLEKQIGVVENFIAQKVDAILINAVDDKGIEPAIKKAKAADIPVIMMANDVKDPYAYKTLYPDYDNMAMQARALATAMGGEGDVALLIGARGNSVSDSREAGFKDTIKKEAPRDQHRHDAGDELGRGQGRRRRPDRAQPVPGHRRNLLRDRPALPCGHEHREGRGQGRHRLGEL